MVLLAGAACSDSGDDGPTSKVFRAPPWTGEEHLVYQLSQKGAEDAGTCELQTLPPAGDGPLTLTRLCSKDEFRDDSTALVDPKTLKPIEATRTRTDSSKDRKAVYTNTYKDGEVEFTANIDGNINRVTRDLPEPTEEAPDPGWYEDDSLLWLVRGIPLEDGWDGSFAYVINGGQPRVLTTELKVESPERVKTPAGEFKAWKVRLSRENVAWTFWVDEQAPHRAVRAVIEDVTYELKDVK